MADGTLTLNGLVARAIAHLDELCVDQTGYCTTPERGYHWCKTQEFQIWIVPFRLDST